MDAQRALLDELMGAERNVPLAQRSNRQLHFTDPGVCKLELAGVCPNQLFTNTRSDLGALASLRVAAGEISRGRCVRSGGGGGDGGDGDGDGALSRLSLAHSGARSIAPSLSTRLAADTFSPLL
jgi:hypothetical protein